MRSVATMTRVSPQSKMSRTFPCRCGTRSFRRVSIKGAASGNVMALAATMLVSHRSHDQGVAAIEDVANFPLPLWNKVVQTRFDQGSGEWQRDGPGRDNARDQQIV